MDKVPFEEDISEPVVSGNGDHGRSGTGHDEPRCRRMTVRYELRRRGEWLR